MPPHRRTAAIALAVLSIIVFVAPTLALTWGPYRPITSSGAALALRGSTAAYADGVAVAYREKDAIGEYRVYVRRSTDGGSTWTVPTELSAGGTLTTPSLAERGNHLDSVFTEFDDGDGVSRVIYRTSANGGGTWSPPLTLSPAGTEAASATVARGGRRTVVVAWTDAITGKVSVRVSDDGGTTFMPKSNLATSANRPRAGAAYDPIEAWATVAISDGMINVAYHTSNTTLKLRRSSNSGDTWTEPRTLATDSIGSVPPSLASGESRDLLIGYTIETSSGFYARSSQSGDRGRTWSSPTQIIGTWAGFTSLPVITFTASRWRVAFQRCIDDCSERHIFYAQSISGTSWSPATKAVGGPRPSQSPVGLTHDDGKVIIVYNAGDGISQTDVRVSQGN